MTTSERRARDEEFTAFVAQHGHALRRQAYLLTGSATQADDLLQTSLEKLYLAWDSIADPAARTAYARRILARTHISAWRRAWRRERPSDEVESAGAPTLYAERAEATDPSQAGLRGVEARDQAWRLLSELPPRTRAVLVLRFYEDLTESDIAGTLGCSVGTVKSHLSRGLSRLRAHHPELTVEVTR